MIRRILAGSRYLILLAVVGAFLAAATTLVYGLVTVCRVIADAFTHGDFTTDGAKHFAVSAIELIDLFLLGTVLYIVALGLYDLFIDRLPMPRWLDIVTLDDLKERLIGVVVVVLGVAFLGQVVDWNGATSIWALGVAVALVIAALSAFLHFGAYDAPHGE